MVKIVAMAEKNTWLWTWDSGLMPNHVCLLNYPNDQFHDFHLVKDGGFKNSDEFKVSHNISFHEGKKNSTLFLIHFSFSAAGVAQPEAPTLAIYGSNPAISIFELKYQVIQNKFAIKQDI